MEFLPDYAYIGVRIKRRRKALKLTQEKVAEASGIGTVHMSQIENGHTKLSLPCIIAIANALNTTVDTLLSDNINETSFNAQNEELSLFSDCTPAETYVLIQTLSKLKQALRHKGLSDYGCGD